MFGPGIHIIIRSSQLAIKCSTYSSPVGLSVIGTPFRFVGKPSTVHQKLFLLILSWTVNALYITGLAK